MTLSTYEEASSCPSCGTAGKFLNSRAAGPMAMPGTKVHLFECPNDRCPDFVPPEMVGSSTVIPGDRMRWSVQVNADGTIPPKGSGAAGPKAFDMPSQHSGAAQKARDRLRYLATADERGGDSSEAREIGRDIGW